MATSASPDSAPAVDALVEGKVLPSPDPEQPLLFCEKLQVKRPIFFNGGALIYDVETQSYWTTHGQHWVRFHVVAKVTISKDDARSFMEKCKNIEEALTYAPKRFPSIKPCVHPALKPTLLYFNALHDSIIVKRNEADSGLAPFYMDKIRPPLIKTLPAAIPFLRPEFTPSCSHIELQTYGPVLYCPSCTSFRVQEKHGDTVVNKTVAVVGRITFFKPTAETIAKLYCADPKTGKFGLEATMNTCEAIFHLCSLKSIPHMPPGLVLSIVLRDSLFVRKFDNKVVSWAEYFKVREDSFGAGEAIALVRLAVALGTLGAVSV
ncbi:hypothetical protein M427DRAFT_59158 [Gonapodya prolifera JEL478]|uniref:Uncharacterized protein n=1 Tax=Gonapodya prolifera (strain JEL478) TaxID=1344416 RepID=A0A139A827_GONPJ|nr:hypothetical protein M427DRAFT_59158 [Gonapodya prolifera JEL478]|eukprot:KXS12838.1 hypothetical protein M427DRAFT_59158 [Gonapodya prolifera JEL478]